MNKKYFLRWNLRKGFNATDKANDDMSEICKEMGYEWILIPDGLLHSNKLIQILTKLYFYIYCFFRIPFGAKLIFRYDLVEDIFYLEKILLLKRVEIIIIIVDVNSYRFNGEISHADWRVLNAANKLVVHTERMKSLLQDNGICNPQFYVLELTDFILEKKNVDHDILGRDVVFAGNLDKSPFIKELKHIEGEHIRYFLYGKASYDVNVLISDRVFYKGVFYSNDPIVDGDWGLVWDGESLDTCSGPLGNYMRYNIPHKATLYLVLGKPLIVWKNAGIADFILKHHLGVVVDSLWDIEDRLNDLDLEEFNHIIENVIIFRDKLRQGEMLKNILNKFM